MEVKRVKSATKFYLIMGIIFLILSIAMIFAVIYSAKGDFRNLFLLIFPLPIIFFITIGGGITMINAYNKRGNFNIYIIREKGNIDFNILNKKYMQIGSENNNLYFIEPKDHDLYVDYSLTHTFK